jgi:hypothetical protein
VIKRVLLLGAIALATGAAVRVSTAPAPAVAVPAPDDPLPRAIASAAAAPGTPSRARWQPLWTRPTPDIAFLSLSPDGSTVAWVDGKGSIRRITASDGRTSWQTAPLKGVNRVLALSHSGGVLAYARMNPSAPLVRVFDPVLGAGRVAAYGVEGAVWSAAAAPDADRAVVGTGRSLLYVLPLRRPAPQVAAVGTAAAAPVAAMRPLRLKTPGIPETVAVVSSEGTPPLALAGTWQDTGVCALGLDGSERWRRDEERSDRAYDVLLSANGAVAVAISSRGMKDADARIHVWDARSGKLMWSQDLAASRAKALVSADGRHIAVSYARDVDGDGTVNLASERRVVLFDREGHRVFAEKGGLFFAPELVALAPNGERIIVRDGAGYLWTLDGRGRILSRDATFGTTATIQEVLPSADARALLIRRGDGQITLFKAASL